MDRLVHAGELFDPVSGIKVWACLDTAGERWRLYESGPGIITKALGDVIGEGVSDAVCRHVAVAARERFEALVLAHHRAAETGES